ALASVSTGGMAGVPAGARSARQASAVPPALQLSGGAEAGERLVLPEQLEALEEPRRDLRAGDGETYRLECLTRLATERLGEPAQRRFDLPRLPWLDRGERV